MSIRSFVRHHYRHFNAAALRDAADGYIRHIDGGGHMMVTLAGAMSTAELGLSLAEMIRQGKVHAITTTGANLEEDLFNLVAHDHYQRIPNWRNLTAESEKELERSGLNRVTDTCIPESEAFRALEIPLRDLWRRAAEAQERLLPHEFLYRLIREGTVAGDYQIDPADSWLVAACERNLPLFVPGWEDSTLGNVFVANVMRGTIPSIDVVLPGTHYMAALADWYARSTMGAPCAELPEADETNPHAPHGNQPASDGDRQPPLRDQQPAAHADAAAAVGERTVSFEEAARLVGFFQIGGGIAGDFPICVVPMIHQDMNRRVPYWGYFCQISDSTTSYGSYSGAIPTEKITWGKLDVETPSYVIESDATIVAPLVFAYVLDW